MGTEDNGMGLAQLLDKVTDLNDLNGVEAYGGLVQNNDLGITQQRLGDAHALLVPLGEGGDTAVLHMFDLGQTDDRVDLPVQLLAPQPLGLTHKGEILQGRLIHIQRGMLRQIADQLLGLVRFIEDVVSINPHMARRCRQAACHDVHGGGLTCAIGAQEAIDVALSDLKR